MKVQLNKRRKMDSLQYLEFRMENFHKVKSATYSEFGD